MRSLFISKPRAAGTSGVLTRLCYMGLRTAADRHSLLGDGQRFSTFIIRPDLTLYSKLCTKLSFDTHSETVALMLKVFKSKCS